jgi:diguanylate cyclase (GGDEF)-like protein/PAS domain S-box-containing protein
MINEWLEHPEPGHLPLQGGKVLVVDDEPRMCESLMELLTLRGFDHAACTSGRQAISLLNQQSFDTILLDINMPDMSGLELMDYLTAAGILTPVIVVSGDTSINAAIHALRRGVYDFIRKPYEVEELLKTVENAIYKTKLEQSNKIMYSKLEHSRNLYRYLIDSSPDFIYTLDKNGNFNFVNDRAQSLLGYSKEELLGKHYTFLVHQEDIDRAKYVFNERRADSRTDANIELRLNCKHEDPSFRYFDTSFVTIVLKSKGLYNIDNDASTFLGTYGVARDISDRKKIEEAVNHQAYHDALTDLPNRALFKDRLKVAIAQAEREDEQFAVMFVDLDRFKWVNDTMGHHFGDELLKMVAVRLKQCLRKGDTLARIGGDEFNILLPKVKNRDDVRLAVNKILEQFDRSFELEDSEVFVSASIGIAMFPEHGDDIETLVKCADIAMYHVKWEGKNRYFFYNSEMNGIFHRRLAMENDLRHALARPEQFLLHYQPQVDISLGRIVGLEVLVRWIHPEHGLVPPSEFIPLAEETGMITHVTELVFERACRQFNLWRKMGHTNIKMAVNFSPKDIHRNDFVHMIKSGLEKQHLPKDTLEVEITESTVMGDLENTVSKLKELSAQGVKISIDDFGTCYSSLGYLKKFPLDNIKIDKSFVHDIQGSPHDIPIVSAITAIAHGFKKGLIAEGVETIEQMHVLQQLGCSVMQGFLFSRPLPAEEATRFLDNPEIMLLRQSKLERAAAA